MVGSSELALPERRSCASYAANSYKTVRYSVVKGSHSHTLSVIRVLECGGFETIYGRYPSVIGPCSGI